MTVSERFKEIRDNYGLTQGVFGEKLGVGRTTISDIESGRIQPNHQILEKLYEIYDIDLNWLLCGSGKMKKNAVFMVSDKQEVYGINFKDRYIKTLEEVNKLQKETSLLKEKLNWYELNCDCSKTKQAKSG